MASPNRTSLTTKMYKVLKRHYKPILTPERPLLETMLFAACLENAGYDVAEKAYAALSAAFFDWNEVRVTTIKELAETMPMLPRSEDAAQRVKSILQAVFEATYSFELESMLKLNLGQAQQKLGKFEGVTPFVIAVATQLSLGGHSIPIDQALLDAFAIVGIVTEAEQNSGTLPALEKAIPKNKGIEFASLAHQFASELRANPYSPTLHKVLLEIAPEAKDRLPKRPAKGAKPPEADKTDPAAKSHSVKPAAPRSDEAKKEQPKAVGGKKEAAKVEPPRKEASRAANAKKEAPRPAAAKAEPAKAAKSELSKSTKAPAKPPAASPKKKPHARTTPRKPK